LRHAAARAGPDREGRRAGAQVRGRDANLGRQGLRRYRPGAVLRPDAEVRMAADRARRRQREGVERGHPRRQRVCRRHRAEGGAGPGAEGSGRGGHAPHRLPRPRPERRPESGGNAAPPARRGPPGDRALLGSRRILGHLQGQFRDRAEGRQAGRAPGAEGREAARRLRMPARWDSHPPGNGEAGRRERARQGAAPDRAVRPCLRADSLNHASREVAAMHKTEITRDDIMPLEAYLGIRREKRREVSGKKRNRRVAVGPYATFYFESYETMWFQVHEMLAIERGGEEQIADELEAYNPLVPKGRELVATVMFEIDDPVRRKAVLGKLGGVEETMTVTVDGEKIRARAEEDVDRTNAAG